MPPKLFKGKIGKMGKMGKMGKVSKAVNTRNVGSKSKIEFHHILIFLLIIIVVIGLVYYLTRPSPRQMTIESFKIGDLGSVGRATYNRYSKNYNNNFFFYYVSIKDLNNFTFPGLLNRQYTIILSSNGASGRKSSSKGGGGGGGGGAVLLYNFFHKASAAIKINYDVENRFVTFRKGSGTVQIPPDKSSTSTSDFIVYINDATPPTDGNLKEGGKGGDYTELNDTYAIMPVNNTTSGLTDDVTIRPRYKKEYKDNGNVIDIDTLYLFNGGNGGNGGAPNGFGSKTNGKSGTPAVYLDSNKYTIKGQYYGVGFGGKGGKGGITKRGGERGQEGGLFFYTKSYYIS